MLYVITFLEGVTTFISPCLLPMLPIYVSYFAGQDSGEKRKKAFINALGFVLGFTLVFVALGALAGTFGSYLKNHTTLFNIICGLVMILFGLNFIGVFNLPFINSTHKLNVQVKSAGFFSAMLFGIVFSIGWTPCVGAFLGSALMLAASSGESLQGILRLLTYSLGLGIPFIISALLIDHLKSTFDWIKKHYRIITVLSGGLLIVVGILMATGFMGYFLSLLTF